MWGSNVVVPLRSTRTAAEGVVTPPPAQIAPPAMSPMWVIAAYDRRPVAVPRAVASGRVGVLWPENNLVPGRVAGTAGATRSHGEGPTEQVFGIPIQPTDSEHRPRNIPSMHLSLSHSRRCPIQEMM